MFLPNQLSGVDINGKSAIAKLDTEILEIKNFYDNRVPISDIKGFKKNFYKPFDVYGVPIHELSMADVGNYDLLTPDKKLFRLNNARIIGSRWVYSENALYGLNSFTDAPDIVLAYSKIPYYFNGFILNSQLTDFSQIYVKKSTSVHIVPNAFFLSDIEPGNFGSFIFRSLPQLIYLSNTGLKIGTFIVPDTSHYVIQALTFLFPDAEFISYSNIENYRFAELYFYEDFSFEGLFDSDSKILFDRFLEGFIGNSGSTIEKIFISRKFSNFGRSKYRPLLNELEIERYLNSLGFKTITPELLSLQNQLKLISSAKQVVTVSGSNCYPLLFSTVEPKILHMESFHFTLRQAFKLYCTVNSKYSVIFGRYEELYPNDKQPPDFTKSWSIDFELMKSAVSEFF